MTKHFHPTSFLSFTTYRQICSEMHANEIHAFYYRHHKVSPSPNPHLTASNSVKHEDIWKLQLIVCNVKYPSSQLSAFLDISAYRVANEQTVFDQASNKMSPHYYR